DGQPAGFHASVPMDVAGPNQLTKTLYAPVVNCDSGQRLEFKLTVIGQSGRKFDGNCASLTAAYPPCRSGLELQQDFAFCATSSSDKVTANLAGAARGSGSIPLESGDPGAPTTLAEVPVEAGGFDQRVDLDVTGRGEEAFALRGPLDRSGLTMPDAT